MTQTNETITVKYATSNVELEAVKAIYRSSKRELGFLPDGAFQERYDRGQILIVVVDGTIAGYVLFSTNQKYEVRIAHLVIARAFQGRKLSTYLIDRLKLDFASHSRIRLNCRSDFAAAKIWQRLGFVAGSRIVGKKIGGSELIVYQFRLNDMPLFDQKPNVQEVPTIVCDANVCIDIQYTDRPRHENSCGLLADWLADEVSLAVSDEIFNDLDRQQEPMRSEMLSSIRATWEVIVADQSLVELNRDVIRSILGDPKDPSEVSDQRHLAIAAAHKASAFATFDEQLLKNAPEIFGKTGLRVQRPSEIISEIDSVLRASVYQYREMRNTGIERRRVKLIKEIDLEDFICVKSGESTKSLSGIIDGALSRPGRFEVYQIRDSKENSLALILAEKIDDCVYFLKRFRVSRRLAGTRLGNVITELIAYYPLGAWKGNQNRLVKVDDPNVELMVLLACLRRGFQFSNGEYWRVSLPGIWSRGEVASALNDLVAEHGLPNEIGESMMQLAESNADDGGSFTQQLEKAIHPGKASFGLLPTYVIPIQPEWAQELFDFRIWSRPLLKMDTQLVVNPDSVYYKRPRNSPQSSHGRILWYVSGDTRRGGGCVRACSVLTKGVNGSVKDLFREYQRLGVFEWRHLMDHFDDANSPAFAVEFTNTELFPNPISLDELNAILVEDGMKRQQFVSSVKISQVAFEKIYQHAFNEE